MDIGHSSLDTLLSFNYLKLPGIPTIMLVHLSFRSIGPSLSSWVSWPSCPRWVAKVWFFARQFKNLKSIYVSRFFPVCGTPLEDHPRCSTIEGSRIIAIARLVLRDIDIGPAAGWSYDDIPMWVMAGGGNRIGGVHVNRVPGYRNNWYLHSALSYHDRMEFRNTIETAGRLLKETGIDVVY